MVVFFSVYTHWHFKWSAGWRLYLCHGYWNSPPLLIGCIHLLGSKLQLFSQILKVLSVSLQYRTWRDAALCNVLSCSVLMADVYKMDAHMSWRSYLKQCFCMRVWTRIKIFSFLTSFSFFKNVFLIPLSLICSDLVFCMKEWVLFSSHFKCTRMVADICVRQ